MLCDLDHFAVAAERLEDGVAWVEERLGVALAPGGKHPAMGTHNRLLGLGPGVYMEVIAVDPDAAPPGRPRWFDLDRFAGRPRPANWIVRTGDIEAALGKAPDGAGVPMPLQRGDLRWRMAVPDDGVLPFENAYPALIQWDCAAHPADRLPDVGCRLKRIEIAHPDAIALNEALSLILNDHRVAIVAGDPAFRVEIDTPGGVRVLE